MSYSPQQDSERRAVSPVSISGSQTPSMQSRRILHRANTVMHPPPVCGQGDANETPTQKITQNSNRTIPISAIERNRQQIASQYKTGRWLRSNDIDMQESGPLIATRHRAGEGRTSTRAQLETLHQYANGETRLRRTVDRTGRRHRSWRRLDGRIIERFSEASEQLRYHPAAGYLSLVGSEVSTSQVTAPVANAQLRRQLRCDLSSLPDHMEDRLAWRWPGGGELKEKAPGRKARVFGASRGAGASASTQTTLSFGSSTRQAPLGLHRQQPWHEERRGPRDLLFTSNNPNPASAERWCQFTNTSNIWFKSTYFRGTCLPPAHPRVRMWQRCVAAHQRAAQPQEHTTRSKCQRSGTNHERKRLSIDRGEWIQTVR